MVNELTKLYNTLMLIETKGENTKIMGQCLQYLEQMIVTEKSRLIEKDPSKEDNT